MSADLTSYTNVLTEVITVVTALVAAVAGLLAAVRIRRREQVIAPVPALRYVTTGGSSAPMAELRMPRAVRCAAQRTVTKIPQWVSSTRTPIMLIVILLVAISSVIVNRVQSRDGQPLRSSVTATRLLTGIDDYSVSIGPDDTGVITVNGQVRELSGITEGEKVVLFVHGLTHDNAADGTIVLQTRESWMKVGEATLDARGAWSAVCEIPGMGVRDTTTTRSDDLKISIAAIVVSPETARFVKPTMTLADLDAYGRPRLVEVTIRREQRGAPSTGVASDTSPATRTPGAPAH